MKKSLLAIISTIILSGCFNYPVYNTEIFCPGEAPILVKFVTASDLKNAAIKDYYDQLRQNTNHSKTIFKLADNRSFSIDLAPGLMIGCQFRQSNYGQVDNNYIHYF